MSSFDFGPMPDQAGFFGEFGGQIIPPELKAIMDEIDQAYEEIRQMPEFQEELAMLLADYVGRPALFIMPVACPINSAVRASS